MAKHSTLVAGIDTAKDKLDVAVQGLDEDFTVANDGVGFKEVARRFKQLRVSAVGIEATYLAALPASFRWNPALVALYARLRARGKTHCCALIACARKLLIMANAVVQRGTP
jgi:transposase